MPGLYKRVGGVWRQMGVGSSPPVETQNAPTNLHTTGTSIGSLSVAWTAPAGGAASYDLLLDGVLAGIVGGSDPLVFVFSALASNSTHTLGVRARSAGGAVSATVTIQASTQAGDPVLTGFPGIDYQVGPDAAGFGTRVAATWGPATGQTITGKVFDGEVVLQNVSNVTFQGCEFVAPNGAWSNVRVVDPVSGIRFLDCLFRGASVNSGPEAHIWGWADGGVEVRRCEFKWCGSDDLKLSGGDYKFYNNYVHANINPPPDPAAHVDLLETSGGPCAGMEIVGNTFLFPAGLGGTCCINLQPNGSSDFYHDVLVQGNLMSGGAYVLYGPGYYPGATQAYNCVVKDNHFSTQGGAFPNGGNYGTHYSNPGTVAMEWGVRGNVWSGNVWHDGPSAGQTVEA